MTHELTMVVYAAIILFVMIGFQGGIGLLKNGLTWGGGARDVPAKDNVLHGRATVSYTHLTLPTIYSV